MIIGAGVYQVPIIERAKERGIFTIVISPAGPYPGLSVADRVYYQDVRDRDEILEIAIKEEIDGVITDQTDIAVRTVAYVAEKMGLPGIGFECAKLFTDKRLMREKCRQLGLPTIEYAEVKSFDEALAFYYELGSTAIIKPVDSQGSRGVSKIDSVAKLKKKFAQTQKYSHTGEVIIERFINGKEMEVDSIAADYNVETLMHADLTPYDIPDVFASTTRLYPSIADENTINRLLELNKKIIKGFGLKQGLTHGEYIVDEDGEIYLIEIAARGGGTYISSHIAELQTGINTSDFLLDISMGNRNDIPKFEGGMCACGYVTFYLPAGTVVGMDGVEDVKEMDSVCKHSLDGIHIGLHTESFQDKTARYAVIAYADSRANLYQEIRKIKDLLKIKVDTGSGIEGPVWK